VIVYINPKLRLGNLENVFNGLFSVLPVMLNPEIEQCEFFTSSSKKNKEIEEMANKYNKKCEANAHIDRSILFFDGRM